MQLVLFTFNSKIPFYQSNRSSCKIRKKELKVKLWQWTGHLHLKMNVLNKSSISLLRMTEVFEYFKIGACTMYVNVFFFQLNILRIIPTTRNITKKLKSLSSSVIQKVLEEIKWIETHHQNCNTVFYCSNKYITLSGKAMISAYTKDAKGSLSMILDARYY